MPTGAARAAAQAGLRRHSCCRQEAQRAHLLGGRSWCAALVAAVRKLLLDATDAEQPEGTGRRTRACRPVRTGAGRQAHGAQPRPWAHASRAPAGPLARRGCALRGDERGRAAASVPWVSQNSPSWHRLGLLCSS